MHTVCSAAIGALLLLGTGCRTRGPVGTDVRGPLPTRIQHPLALTELAFRPRRPVAQEAGTTGFALQGSYASLFSTNAEGDASFSFDGELARAVLRVRHGLGAGLDLEAELAGTHSGGGFLDAFVEGFHELLSLPDGGREEAADDAHDMAIWSAGERTWNQPPDVTGVADLPVLVSWSGGASGTQAVRRWRWGVRAGVELPTGSEEDGLGNGGIDWGAGVLAERSAGRWTHHLAGWWVSVAQPSGFEAAGLRLEDAAQLEYAIELRAFPSVSWVAQLQLRTPLVRDIDLEGIREPILDLALGALGDAGGRGRWFASFHEDLISRSGPDFALALGLTWNL